MSVPIERKYDQPFPKLVDEESARGERIASQRDEIAEPAVVDLAQRAVYARCSKFAAWREGSVIEGTYVFRRTGAPEMVNVGVRLARLDQVARGHTLWYRVDFADGKPKTFRANKEISAELCGLDAPEVDVAL